MSRRKQEKPQPRKIYVKEDAAELAQDILTCGVCRRDFPLCEIVRFIQHKVNICNKENNCLNKLFGIPPEDSDSEDESLQTVPHKKSSLLLQRPAATSDADHVTSSTLKNAFAKDTSTKDNSEPCTYICSTCRQSHTSAWDLLQHVQNQHGFDLYVESPSHQVRPNTEETDVKVTTPESSARAPLLERQKKLDYTGPLILRPSSQEPRLDLFALSSATAPNMSTPSSPPPLIEMHHLDSSPRNETTFEPKKLDFCSQRLRELAGATSLNALVSSKLLQPNFKVVVKDEQRESKTITNNNELNQIQCITTPHTPPPLPQQSSSASSTTSENPISPKPNPKECDFCGRSFRFLSNLVVHRRSHTGEKPFKCHICNHACTQASKLKRHMKTHERRSGKRERENIDDDLPMNRHLTQNGTAHPHIEADKTKDIQDGYTNGKADYNSDDQKARFRNRDHVEEDDDGDIDVEDDDDDDDDDTDYKKLTVDLNPDEGIIMMAEDLSNKPIKNGTPLSENNCLRKEGMSDNHENKSIVRHSLLSEVMEKIGLANIQQYSEAYKQALKESSIIKNDHHHSDGSTSNDGSHYPERPSREGTRSAGPLNFTPNILSAFDQSMGLKRIKLEENWRDKEDNLYAGLWIPSVSTHNTHSMSSYKDLFSSDGSDRRKSSKIESALNSISPSSARSSSPRPGPSNSLYLRESLKPKEQRRNDTCEYCGKIFKNCSNLTVHRRSHTGEKPYKCELCSYACAQSSKLTRHMKTHGRMGKDVYRCRFCDMPFSVPSTLEKHMRKCVVSQSGGSSYLLSERESDSKEMIA